MLLLSTALAADWTVLQTDQVDVRCRAEAVRNACVARARMSVAPQTLQLVLEDIDGLAAHFDTIDRAVLRADGQVELAFGLPWMLGAWSSLSRPRSWTDAEGWHLSLDVVESTGRTALFEHLQFDVLAGPTDTDLRIRWTHALPWPAVVRNRIARQQGHNLVWGLAVATGSQPQAPVASVEAPR